MLPDSNGRWNLIEDKIQYNVVVRNAKLALVLGLSIRRLSYWLI
jgi:hypothetical protein